MVTGFGSMMTSLFVTSNVTLSKLLLIFMKFAAVRPMLVVPASLAVTLAMPVNWKSDSLYKPLASRISTVYPVTVWFCES